MTRPVLSHADLTAAGYIPATIHGTGWQKNGAGDWTTTPGYCWCGVLARDCPEPKQHVSAAEASRLDEQATAVRLPGFMPDGVDFFGLSL